MRRNLWGNADSVDNERNGLFATTEIQVRGKQGAWH
jgi:hypothetical protein